MEYRIGIGYDLHLLVEGIKLFLGGVEIPYSKGLLGHSDADVLLHALADALLGAVSEKDIGELFPDTDPKYKGISSIEILKKAYALIKDKGYSVGNIDAVIIAQEPELAPFKKQMQERIAEVLKVKEDAIGIKAKTQEGIGEIGQKRAIAGYAVVLLHKEK